MERTDARRLRIEALNERRRRAVKLRLSGMQLDDVAVQAELSKGTIIAAMKAFAAAGWAAVKVRERGRAIGDRRTLSAEQEAAMRRLICHKTPDHLKMPFALRTRAAVGELIHAQLGIKLPVRTIGHYLKRWGFTPLKPICKAYEQRPAEVRAWLEDEYPAIAARAKAEGAQIQWGDETGLRSDDVRGRGFSPKGKTPAVRVCQKRENLSLIWAVTNQGKVRWMVFEGALNARTLIELLGRLVKDAGHKVFPILDNPRVHHARRVREWLEEHET